jgi:hypothetical protein
MDKSVREEPIGLQSEQLRASSGLIDAGDPRIAPQAVSFTRARATVMLDASYSDHP